MPATLTGTPQTDRQRTDRPQSSTMIPSENPNRKCPPVRERQPIQKRQPIQNRVSVLLVHIPKLSIQGQARLAAEVGVSRSTISRLVGGRINPSYRLARGVTSALEKLIGYPLDMRDVFSTDGTYPTPSGCALCRCGGCLPDRAYDRESDLRPEWRGRRPGDWSLTPPMDTPSQANVDAESVNGTAKGGE